MARSATALGRESPRDNTIMEGGARVTGLSLTTIFLQEYEKSYLLINLQ